MRWKSAANLVRKIAENYKLPYYTLSPTYSVCRQHGYLPGEQKKCPHCGEETEVYSRITGYYRPIKNWNDGKQAEYKDRKTYDVKSECLDGCSTDESAILFTTETCPMCKLAKRELAKHPEISFIVVVSDQAPDLVKQYDIHKAPTLAFSTDIKFVGVSEIKKYLESLNESK